MPTCHWISLVSSLEFFWELYFLVVSSLLFSPLSFPLSLFPHGVPARGVPARGVPVRGVLVLGVLVVGVLLYRPPFFLFSFGAKNRENKKCTVYLCKFSLSSLIVPIKERTTGKKQSDLKRAMKNIDTKNLANKRNAATFEKNRMKTPNREDRAPATTETPIDTRASLARIFLFSEKLVKVKKS